MYSARQAWKYIFQRINSAIKIIYSNHSKMKTSMLFMLLWPMLFFTLPARAQNTTCRVLSHPELNKLEKLYEYGDIRIFYTEKAPKSGTDHRLPSQSMIDINGNGVPDFIDNIAKQADIARKTYNHLGFRDPLTSPRYTGISYIDINILNMAANGLAYTERVAYPSAPNRGDACTLRLDISSRLEAGSVISGNTVTQAIFTKYWFVVAHEMFHFYQYGYTTFKRSWINEPLARWAEYTFRLQNGYPLGMQAFTLPGTLNDFQTLIANPDSTDANKFWSRMISLTDQSSDALDLPAYMTAEQYTDGEKVFKDGKLKGASFVRSLFEELSFESDVASTENARDRFDWTAADQNSDNDDSRLLNAIQRVIRRTSSTSEELKAFLGIEDNVVSPESL